MLIGGIGWGGREEMGRWGVGGGRGEVGKRDFGIDGGIGWGGGERWGGEGKDGGDGEEREGGNELAKCKILQYRSFRLAGRQAFN